MRLVVVGVLLVAGAGCATSRTTSSSYLAKVNEETITAKELSQEFGRSHRGLDKLLGDEKDVRKYIAIVVDRRLFVQEGYRIGLHESRDVAEAVDRFRGQKLVDALLKDEIDEASKPTDEEVKAVHASLTHQLHMRQIVVRTKDEADAIASALRSGADFEALARQKSIAPSARHGGMLIGGWGGDEAHEAVVPKLAEGEVSPVFQSLAGWEIVRLEKRQPLEKLPKFEEVEKPIRQILAKRKRAARKAALQASLWSKYDVRILECGATLDQLRKAAATNDATPCATWQGGTLTAAQLAGRVKLDQLQPADWAERRHGFVEEIVAREVTRRDAEARGYLQRPEIIDAVRVQQDELVESKLYVEHVTKGIKVTDDDARRYYEAHKDAYVEDAKYDLAHVLVDTPEAAATVEEKVRSRQPFKEIAAAHSKDKDTAQDGGRVGVFEKRKLTGPFAPIAALEEGGVSGVIQTKAGYHVIKVLGITPPRQQEFDEVREDALKKALQERKDAERDRWVGELRRAARVEINERGIRAFQETRVASMKDEVEADRAKEAARAAAEAAAAEPAAPAAAAEGAPTPPTPAPSPAPGAPTASGTPAAPAPSAPNSHR